MAWRAMIPKNTSTRFSQEPLVGVKRRLTRGFLSSRRFAVEWRSPVRIGQCRLGVADARYPQRHEVSLNRGTGPLGSGLRTACRASWETAKDANWRVIWCLGLLS